MTSNNFFLNKLKEKIYYGNIKSSEQEILIKLYDFFFSLYKRKRYVPFEGGLQASLVCLDDSFAAKICEDDGKEPHMINEYNLYNYLNNNNRYISYKDIRKPNLFINDLSCILNSGFSIRILSGDETLVLAIVSNINIDDQFQIDILKKIISICQILLNNNFFQDIQIGVHTNNIKIELDESNNNFKEIFDSLLNIEKNNKKLKYNVKL